MSGLRAAAARLRAGLIVALRHAIGAALSAVVCLAVVQMTLRYGFGAALSWAEDLSVLIILSAAWAGGLLLWLERRHVAVTALTDLFGPRGRDTFRIGTDLVAAAFGIALVPLSFATAEMFSGIDLAGLEGVDASVRYWPIAAGGAMLALGALIDMVAPAPAGDPADALAAGPEIG